MADLRHGDCLEIMAAMDAGSVDAVVTDPPYGLNFMGKKWDAPGAFVERQAETRNTFDHVGGNHHACNPSDGARSTANANRRAQDWHQAWATEALRVLKPSHYLLAFGGTRTWHRLACAIEDAGFEIRDTLMWLYGSGFPKGKSCLKPAWEPIILARKPGPMRELGIEECRVEGPGWMRPNGDAGAGFMSGKFMGAAGIGEPTQTDGVRESSSGRWPANLILDEEAGAMLDGQTGTITSRNGSGGVKTQHFPYRGGGLGSVHPGYCGDSGGASRFFYCAKASRSERNAGCEGMDAKASSLREDGRFNSGGRTVTNGEWTETGSEPQPKQNHHPTVKPLALMRWLVKLVAQSGDVVLDPFMGSGTTGVACAEEGREFIGIEREAEYLEISRRRVEAASAQERLPV